MASGVAIDDQCKTHFADLKLRSTYQYIIYTLTDDLKRIVVEKTGVPGAPYEEFLSHLKGVEAKGECRFAVFDVETETKEGQKTNKIAFFMWSPEGSKIKQKMVYASSKEALTRALGDGIAKVIQANDFSDLQWSAVQLSVGK